MQIETRCETFGARFGGEDTREVRGWSSDGTAYRFDGKLHRLYPISRDTSRLCNSCRQLSSITPGIPASVSSVRGGKHGLPPRRGQTPGFRVCQPLLHDPKPSGGERCCPFDFHLASRRPRQIRKRRIDILDEIATSKSRRFVVSEFFY